MKEKKLIIVYEQEQVEGTERYIQSLPEQPDVLALDFWVEQLLKERTIPYTSITAYPHARLSRVDLLHLTDTFCREWYRLPETAFFEHRGLRIAEASEIIISNLAQRVLYFTHLLQPVFEAHPEYQRIIIPQTTAKVPLAAGPVDFFEYRAPVDVARLLARRYRRSFEIMGKTEGPPRRPARDKSTWRHFALSLLNYAVTRFSRERPLKLFASEYWSHLGPVMRKMPDAELVLMDRSELKNMSWRDFFRHRIRFIHPQDRIMEATAAQAAKKVERFRRDWERALPAIQALAQKLSDDLVDIPWWEPVLEGIYHVLNWYAERVILEADGIWRILETENINRVLLRASISGRQHHFFTAAFVAHELNIPSLEIQHAGGEFDPSAPGSRLCASYLASYGDFTRNLYIKNFGIASERIRPVGSPRFDAYLRKIHLTDEERVTEYGHFGLNPNRITVLAAVPVENTGAALSTVRHNSYDVADFFEVFARLREETPNVQILFKFRQRECTPAYRRYIAELFPRGGAAITDADFFPALRVSDMVVSPKSTVMYETIMVGKPLICYPWKEDMYARIYEQVGPMFSKGEPCIAFIRKLMEREEAREEVVARQGAFLRDNFSLDGNASERIAKLFREPLKSFPAAFE